MAQGKYEIRLPFTPTQPHNVANAKPFHLSTNLGDVYLSPETMSAADAIEREE